MFRFRRIRPFGPLTCGGLFGKIRQRMGSNRRIGRLPSNSPREEPGLDRPLTPEECKQTADSFADLAPEFRLSVEDLQMLQEELHNKAMRFGSPEAAAEAMKCWLAALKSAKAKALARLDDCAESLRESLLRDIDELNRDIAAVEQRLAGYDFQKGHEN